MYNSFSEIIRAHTALYPLMQPQDYGKLAYQSTFGPAHILSRSRTEIDQSIMLEMAQLAGNASQENPVYIGNELYRYSLSAMGDDDCTLMSRLLIKTAREHQAGSGIGEKIEVLKAVAEPDMKSWLRQWEHDGYPTVSHSNIYKDAYSPHYRLLSSDYAYFFPIIAKIERLLRSKEHVCIAIDGRCGSGKTHYSAVIASIFDCNVVHMDDFYLAPCKRANNWCETPGGNIDFVRLNYEVLAPLRQNEEASYKKYDCQMGEYSKPVKLSGKRLTIVEGSYSLHPSIENSFDLKIFLTCSAEEQKHRLARREGTGLTSFESIWIPAEERYLQDLSIEKMCDCILHTDSGQPCFIWVNKR